MSLLGSGSGAGTFTEEWIMRGRRPAGPEYVDQLDGTAQDKERLQAILETLGGQARLQEACDRIAVGESRFRQLREAALQGALDAIVPRPAGRPRQACSSEAERIRELEAALVEKELELHAAQVRAEVALVLPRVVDGQVGPEKKTRRPSAKLRRRKPR